MKITIILYFINDFKKYGKVLFFRGLERRKDFVRERFVDFR
jgi:hypothetical protein